MITIVSHVKFCFWAFFLRPRFFTYPAGFEVQLLYTLIPLPSQAVDLQRMSTNPEETPHAMMGTTLCRL